MMDIEKSDNQMNGIFVRYSIKKYNMKMNINIYFLNLYLYFS